MDLPLVGVGDEGLLLAMHSLLSLLAKQFLVLSLKGLSLGSHFHIFEGVRLDSGLVLVQELPFLANLFQLFVELVLLILLLLESLLLFELELIEGLYPDLLSPLFLSFCLFSLVLPLLSLLLRLLNPILHDLVFLAVELLLLRHLDVKDLLPLLFLFLLALQLHLP